jgi:hypothetical protein
MIGQAHGILVRFCSDNAFREALSDPSSGAWEQVPESEIVTLKAVHRTYLELRARLSEGMRFPLTTSVKEYSVSRR